MFCPKCGGELVETRDGLTCVRGNMPLSQGMARRLTESFVTKTHEPAERSHEFEWGSNWYCPGCGVQAPEEIKGIVRCPNCKRWLNEFLYELAELHPHAKVTSSAPGAMKLDSEKG